MRKSETPFKIFLLTASVVLLAGSTRAIKMGKQVVVTAVNGLAFYDCNANGIRDNNEPTFAGIPVTLTGRTTAGDSVNVSTTTNSAGNYSFIGLAAGQFVVKFNFPNGSTGLNFTTKNTATDGSDANPNGATDPLSIDGLTDVQGIDVGIIDNSAPIVTFINPFLRPYANGDTITVECDNLPTMNASWATAQDNSGAPVLVQFIDLAISVNDCARTGYITLLDCIFRATDACGNVGQKAVFVKIKDSKAPVLTNVPAAITINTTRGERIPTAAAANVVATDNCSQNPVSTTVLDTEIANTCGKIITRTWSARDDCGNIGRGTQRITVISNVSCPNPLPTDTFHLVLSTNRVLDTCFNLPIGSVISNIQYCGTGQPNATITLTASNCIRITPSLNFAGRDTFCARVCDVNGLNCRDMTFMLTIQALRFAECNILSGMKNINLMPLVCGENACYCIVGQTDIRTLRNDYTVTDNGRPYDGGYSGCQFDTIFSYNYFAVPERGANGPYRLDAWAVNGTTRQIASFQTMQQLADSMNLWDPMGNWRLDASHYLIFGGDMRSTYGQMRITRLSNGAFGTLDLNRGLISNGVKLCFSTGSHTIIFQNNVTGCADTLRANVFCDNSNRAPIVLNDRFSTPKNTPIRLPVTLNDTLNGVFQSLVALNQPSRGGVGFQDTRTFLYTPNTDFCGRDTFDYQLCNAFGLCSTGRVFITVTCDTTVNNGGRPVAVDDRASTRLNTSLTLTPLTNDTLNGVLVRPLSIIGSPNRGMAFTMSNQIMYIPTTGFCGGNDTLNYEICNANGCDTGRLIVVIACDSIPSGGSGAPIVAVNDNVTTRKNISITFRPTLNDTVRTKLLSLMIAGGPRNGTIAFRGLDTLLYTPNFDFCGRDTIAYMICDTSFRCADAFVYVNVSCDSVNPLAPIAVNDTARTGVNQAVVVSVLQNDTLRGVLSRSLSITAFPRFGTARVDRNNQIIYTPQTGFCGSRDTLAYEICTINGCDTALVSINVVCDSNTLRRLPVAVPDYVNARKRTPIRISILTNDTLNGTLDSIRILNAPRRGTAAIGTDNVLTYATDTCGFADTLIYRICNRNGCDTALVSINVPCQTDTTGGGRLLPIAVNDTAQTLVNQPVTISVLQNDTLNGVLTGRVGITSPPRFGFALVNGLNQIVYTPQNSFCGGRDTLMYEICNANGCDTAIVSINVTCDPITATRPPVAVFDVATTRKNTPIRIAILANDTLNGTLDSIKIMRSPLLGMASLDRNNILTYTPDSCGFTDSLIYRICNRNGCDTAIVFIKVTCDTAPTNLLPPVAVFDTARTAKGISVTIRVTLNDTLRGADTFRITRRPLNGLAIFDASRQIAYTPDALYCGNDTLIYEVCNTRGCDTAIVFIKVVCDTTPLLRPTAVDDNVKTTINRQVDFVILGNDTLRGARSADMVSPPSHGTILIMPDSMAMYKPDKEFCGRDSFLYRICNTVGCDTAWVKIDVSCGDTLQVFRGFSPNNDRINDVLVIRGIENYPDNEVLIFNRWGNQVFTRKGYRNEDGWDGSWNGKFVPDGTYFYFIKLNDAKNPRQFTGYIQLVR